MNLQHMEAIMRRRCAAEITTLYVCGGDNDIYHKMSVVVEAHNSQSYFRQLEIHPVREIVALLSNGIVLFL